MKTCAVNEKASDNMTSSASPILTGQLSRFSLSLAQFIFSLGCLAAAMSAMATFPIAFSQESFIATIGIFIAGAILAVTEFCLFFALVVITTYVKQQLFETDTPTRAILVRCSNGHDVGATTGQIGTQIACPTCDENTWIPSRSDENRD